MLQKIFADLHIHIGRDIYNKPVKITGARTLTLTNILKASSRTKGLDLIGIIDCHAPAVQEEIKTLIAKGLADELVDGGIRFEKVTLILGAEIEIYDKSCEGPIHVLVFMKTLADMKKLTAYLAKSMKNITLSSQRFHGEGKALQAFVKEHGGLFIPAHVFTPFKGLYGKGVKYSLTEIFNPEWIDGIELGLSSDCQMADAIEELHRYEFVTNSDAHSLPKIAREYSEMCVGEPSFTELEKALNKKEGRKITRYFGMNPLLGKYSETVCAHCRAKMKLDEDYCSHCQSARKLTGVKDRIEELRTTTEKRERPEYIYQVPLEYIPKLGPKTLAKLLDHFGTEMNVIHQVSYDELVAVVSPSLATAIIQLREGKLQIQSGGGGIYGKIIER